jgi:hypothetical protein
MYIRRIRRSETTHRVQNKIFETDEMKTGADFHLSTQSQWNEKGSNFFLFLSHPQQHTNFTVGRRLRDFLWNEVVKQKKSESPSTTRRQVSDYFSRRTQITRNWLLSHAQTLSAGRVTRLGEFSPIGWLLTLEVLLKMTTIAKKRGLLFSTTKVIY